MFVLLLYLHLCLAWGLLINEVISYSSILSVCEAAATWTMALRVLEDFEPDLFSSLGTNRHNENLGGGSWLGIVQGYERGYIEYLSSSMFQMMFLLTQSAFGEPYLQDWSDMLKPQCGWGFNSAISACDKGGQLSLARGLLDTMLQAAVLPDVPWQHIRFNNTIRSPAMSLLSMSCPNYIHLSMRMALFQGLFPKICLLKMRVPTSPLPGFVAKLGKGGDLQWTLECECKRPRMVDNFAVAWWWRRHVFFLALTFHDLHISPKNESWVIGEQNTISKMKTSCIALEKKQGPKERRNLQG